MNYYYAVMLLMIQLVRPLPLPVFYQTVSIKFFAQRRYKHRSSSGDGAGLFLIAMLLLEILMKFCRLPAILALRLLIRLVLRFVVLPQISIFLFQTIHNEVLMLRMPLTLLLLLNSDLILLLPLHTSFNYSLT